jgi:hypothetical protein
MKHEYSREGDSLEEPLRAFEAFRDIRITSSGDMSADDFDHVAAAERQALYKHAEAIRTHAARLARRGR